MDLDGYFEKVNEAVNACISRCLSVQDYVVDLTRDEPEIAKKIIGVRKPLLTQQDKDSLSGYLDIGYFREFSSEERMALFSYLFDISRALDVKSLKVRFEQYDKSHHIFSKDSTLHELVRTKKTDPEIMNYWTPAVLNASMVLRFLREKVFTISWTLIFPLRYIHLAKLLSQMCRFLSDLIPVVSMILSRQQPYVKVYLFLLIRTGGNSLKFAIALKKERHIALMHQKVLAMI
jgi:hypothetical protein|tara:strand:+ start:141 stop:839 length:699 start_codon:yes stop_codon:yes gene_type:complete